MEIIYDEFCLFDIETINYLFIYLFYYHHKCYSKLIIIIIIIIICMRSHSYIRNIHLDISLLTPSNPLMGRLYDWDRNSFL